MNCVGEYGPLYIYTELLSTLPIGLLYIVSVQANFTLHFDDKHASDFFFCRIPTRAYIHWFL